MLDYVIAWLSLCKTVFLCLLKKIKQYKIKHHTHLCFTPITVGDTHIVKCSGRLQNWKVCSG
ncbi:unnamed protein product [Gulo gulo]|uniref:Uncharacterized protein n=1 Tax=Gulo gulo TaxID=48420 RepID=A0A9X9Q9W8_GULGU|nr:unnamed protein product [Gulo gulo]